MLTIKPEISTGHHNTQQVRALTGLTKLRTVPDDECGSALSVVVFQMLVGSVAADTKATKEMLTHSTTTETVERTPDKRNRHTTGKSIYHL